MHKIVEVKPMENYRIWVRFSDSVEGTVDLSNLARDGVFAAWNDESFFKSVFVDAQCHTIAWQGGIDLCPDTLYASLIGVDPIALFSEEKKAAS